MLVSINQCTFASPAHKVGFRILVASFQGVTIGVAFELPIPEPKHLYNPHARENSGDNGLMILRPIFLDDVAAAGLRVRVSEM